MRENPRLLINFDSEPSVPDPLARIREMKVAKERVHMEILAELFELMVMTTIPRFTKIMERNQQSPAY